jgi:hypothetical protein
MRIGLLTVIFCTLTSFAFAQSTYAPLNEDYYHSIDRYEVKSGRVTSQLFTGVKPYKRSDIVAFLDTLRNDSIFTSRSDRFNYDYYSNDSWEWSQAESSNSRKHFLKALYKKKSDLFYVDEDAFDFHVNPVLYLGAGNDSRLDDPIFINTRGIEFRGMVDKKVGVLLVPD